MKRRTFLSQLSLTIGSGLIALPDHIAGQDYGPAKNGGNTCWLDVTAPFIVEDPTLGIRSEIVLTSDTFSGVSGYEDGMHATDFEVYLYDSNGRAYGADGLAKRFSVPAMQTTVLSVGDIIGTGRSFFGGMKLRLRPRARIPMHASDLFSSAFVRWTTDESFDNVHANPDPLQWQRPHRFFYSMPFPPLKDYHCIYALFNPYSTASSGTLTVHAPSGERVTESSFVLKPHSSLLFDLREGVFIPDIQAAFESSKYKEQQERRPSAVEGGTVAVTNDQGMVKNFGYLFIKNPEKRRFSIDHPIHQPPFVLTKAKAPFDTDGRFKAKNILYTPLVFRSKRIGGVTLESRFHLSSGAPVEEHLWLNPFITDAKGDVAWQPTNEAKLPATIPGSQSERGIIKLGAFQSCIIDCADLRLPNNLSGGLSLAISPVSNHTLMKVEVRVPKWGAYAFTHFRPGLAAARAYQKPEQRGGLATDYITSGARLELRAGRPIRDEILGVLNIDDRAISGHPFVELFTSLGFLTRVSLGDVPAYGCRHYLLSDLCPGQTFPGDLTLRLVDQRTTLLMSIVHLDYVRRDIALDHGSDRFSTFTEFTCGNDPAR